MKRLGDIADCDNCGRPNSLLIPLEDKMVCCSCGDTKYYSDSVKGERITQEIITTITLRQDVTDDITTPQVLDYSGGIRDWIKEMLPDDLTLSKISVSVEPKEGCKRWERMTAHSA